MNDTDKDALKNFIFQASRATYASGDESIKEKEQDGSTTIRYENGNYKFHDNYFGGEPYGGREVVFADNKPIWMMVYYGTVYATETKEIYQFLRESLSNSTLQMPYRGPETFQRGDFTYENKMTGDVEQFSGTEKIYKNVYCAYEASYSGGFVDIN